MNSILFFRSLWREIFCWILSIVCTFDCSECIQKKVFSRDYEYKILNAIKRNICLFECYNILLNFIHKNPHLVTIVNKALITENHDFCSRMIQWLGKISGSIKQEKVWTMEEIYWYIKEHLPGRIVIKRSLRLKFDKIDRFSPTVRKFFVEQLILIGNNYNSLLI